MAEAGCLKFVIEINDKGTPVIRSVNGEITKLEKTATGATTNMAGGFKATWQSMALGIGTAVAVGAAIINFAQDAIEAERVDRLLGSTLRAHGEAVKIMGPIYDDFAANMQAMTGVEDEQVKGLISLAYNLGVNKNRIEEATRGAVGLTALFGGSMQSNLEAVARAFQGNWRQIDMMIPEIRNLSSESEKLALLQQKMAEGFQASTDAMKGAGGTLTTAKNQWNDFKEGVGKGALTIFSALTDVGNALTGQSALVKRLNEEHERGIRIIEGLKKTHLVYADIIADESVQDARWAAVEKEVNQYFEDKKKVIPLVTKVIKDHIEVEKTLTQTLEERWKAFSKNVFQDQEYVKFVQSKMLPAIESYSDAWADNFDITNMMIETEKEFDAEIERQAAIIRGDATPVVKEWYVGIADLNAALEDLGIGLNSLIPGLGDIVSSGMKAFESLKKLEEAGKSATFGQYASAIGAVVGAIVTMANAADAYNKKQAQEFIKNMEKGIEISTEMAEKIRLLGEEYKGLHGYVNGVWQEPGWEEFHAATSEALNELIDETKMSADAFDDWALRVHQILSDFDSGLMDTAEASAEFGDAFESLMNQAIKLGTEGSASVIAMFDDLISRGMKVAEVTKYIDDQMAAGLDGYKKMQEATKVSADALAAFGGLGIKVFDDMIAYEKKVADNQGLVDGINGATAAMIGLSNSQKLSESQFDDFAVAGSTAYQKLIDGGMTSAEALKTMGPYLQRLQFLHEQYGYTIDDATQAMIDQGIASGIVVENQKTEQQMMIDLLQKMVDILSNGLPAAFATTGTAAAVAFGRAAAAAQMVYDIMNNINNTKPGTGTEYDSGYNWKKDYVPDIYAASGFYSSALPTDMLIQAHKGEPVGIGMAAMGAFFSPRSGSDTGEEASITPAGGGYSSPRSGSDSKTTIIFEDHSVIHLQVDPKSGIDQNALCEALQIVIKDNRQQTTDKIVDAVARKL